MPETNARGVVQLYYEVINCNNVKPTNTIVVTLGGRKGVKAAKTLGETLARRLSVNVLLWDRRNTHNSGVCFEGGPQVLEDVDDLHFLVTQTLKLTSVLLFGSSSGARVSVIFAVRYPLCCSGLILAPPTGGDAVDLLDEMYYKQPLRVLETEGMQGVLLLDDYKEMCDSSKRALLTIPQPVLINAMNNSSEWISRFKKDTFIGAKDNELKKISCKIVIVHDGRMDDPLHTPRTALGLARLLGLQQVFIMPGILSLSQKTSESVATLVSREFLSHSLSKL